MITNLSALSDRKEFEVETIFRISNTMERGVPYSLFLVRRLVLSSLRS